MKWEYCTMVVGLFTGGHEFNDLGKEGWELVTVAATLDGITQTAYFKRPLKD